MARFVQISETSWVNMELVTDIQFLHDHPRQVYNPETQQRVARKCDRLVFSFATGDNEGQTSWVEAVDDWARGLFNSLKYGTLGTTCVVSRGVL